MEAGRPCDSASEGPRSIQTSSAPPMSGSIERYAAELARVEKLLAKQDRELGESQDLNRTYEHEFSLARARFEEQQRIIESLTAERDMLAARQLNVNTFDSSLDRVSEGQIKGEVESLNSNITDTIMNLIETLTPLLASKATPYRIEVEPRDSIISLCVQLGRNANEFDLLLEAILHKFVIRRLHKTFFYGFVAAASRTVPFHKEIDMLFSQEVQKTGMCLLSISLYSDPPLIMRTETWKVAQRWRAVTADAIGRMYPPPVWRGDIEKLMNEITEHVAHSLSMDPTHISPMIISHQPAWEKLWFQALALAISVRRDCLSSQMTVIMISSREAYDPDQMALAWDLPAKEGDYVLGTYSVGLLKQDEKGTETILIQPRVFTNGLLRFAKSAQ